MQSQTSPWQKLSSCPRASESHLHCPQSASPQKHLQPSPSKGKNQDIRPEISNNGPSPINWRDGIPPINWSASPPAVQPHLEAKNHPFPEPFCYHQGYQIRYKPKNVEDKSFSRHNSGL